MRNYQPRPSTLSEVLLQRAEQYPASVGYTWFADDPANEQNLTYSQLYARATSIAAHLHALDAKGHRALLVYSAGPEFLSAFFGCMLAGVIAIPVCPYTRRAHISRREVFEAIIADAKPTLALTSSNFLQERMQNDEFLHSLPILRWITTDKLGNVSEEYRSALGEANDIAYLQYTSGSTALPKGIAITHANVIHNLTDIDQGFQHSRDSVSVSWLPHFHDMGLVYGHIQPLYNGFRCVLMSPSAFISQPIRWLSAISRHRGTHSGAPNFAYDMCVRRITPKQCELLELSSWRIAFSGAEPIRSESLKSFEQAFGPYGFRYRAFYPAYGLAEATLKVTGLIKGQEPLVCNFDASCLEKNQVQEVPESASGSRSLVGCGYPSESTALAIVNSESLRPCGPHEIGEIWVSSPSVAQGYWNCREKTKETFEARLDLRNEAFLRTGDLGFLHQGQLFVTGRLKDLIIVHGANHYPSDIERTVARSDGRLMPGSCAVFAVMRESDEQIVVVQEIRTLSEDDAQALIISIRAMIAEYHGLYVHTVILTNVGSIPKTSSGKVRRAACREMFIAGLFKVLHSSNTDVGHETAIQAKGDNGSEIQSIDRNDHTSSYLLRCLARILRVQPSDIDPTTPLVRCGLDSLMMAEFQSEIRAAFGAYIPISTLLSKDVDLKYLVRTLRSEANSAIYAASNLAGYQRSTSRVATSAKDMMPMERVYPLSFEQERFWILEQLSTEAATYNIASLIRINGQSDYRILERCVNMLLGRHEALRASVFLADGQPVQRIREATNHTLFLIDLQDCPEAIRDEKARLAAQQYAEMPFELAGPLVRFACIRLSERTHMLLIAAHHIISDQQSIVILTRDLAEFYNYASCKDFACPEQATGISYADFADWQKRCIDEGALDNQIAYWKTKLCETSPSCQLSTDRPRPNSRHGQAKMCEFSISASVSDALRELSKAEGVTLFVLLLAAFKALVFRWSGQHDEDVVLGTPILGRAYPGTQEIVGLFAYPIILRTAVSRTLTFRALMKGVCQTVVEAQENQNLPLSKILDVATFRRGARHAVFSQVMFALNKPPQTFSTRDGVTFSPSKLDLGVTDSDFFMTMEENDGELRGRLIYRADLFEERTAKGLCEDYLYVLQECTNRADMRLDEWPIFPSELTSEQQNDKKDHDGKCDLVIAATFTADLVEETLAFWMQYLDFAVRISFAPYNQMLHELLGKGSRRLVSNRKGLNVLLVRVEDWLASGTQRNTEGNAERFIVKEFIAAVKACCQNSAVPYLVVICPASPALVEDRLRFDQSRAIEDTLIFGLTGIPNVHVTTSAQLCAMYPVTHYFDKAMDHEVHIPYTAEMFAALGTSIARKFNALFGHPYKVIVLDCDRTLWRGACGEGEEIVIDPPYRDLQRFMLAQRSAGMALCLCSKNNEEDVISAFKRHPEMPLKYDDFTAHRVNWHAKSTNIKSIAWQLRVALDSIMFVDDDPIECAEVQANCPEVLTLKLPEDTTEFQRFLEHTWAFDHLTITSEDKNRASFYRDEMLRDDAREASLSFREFIEGLELNVTTRPIQEQEVSRAAELTQRTNQFNSSTIRRSEADLRCITSRPDYKCLAVHVQDRFGDYGLVGLIIGHITNRVLMIESLLLSCRALGRGIEYRMLAFIARVAIHEGVDLITIPFRVTSRNRPAFEFLKRIDHGRPFGEPKDWTFSFVPMNLELLLDQLWLAEISGPDCAASLNDLNLAERGA